MRYWKECPKGDGGGSTNAHYAEESWESGLCPCLRDEHPGLVPVEGVLLPGTVDEAVERTSRVRYEQHLRPAGLAQGIEDAPTWDGLTERQQELVRAEMRPLLRAAIGGDDG